MQFQYKELKKLYEKITSLGVTKTFSEKYKKNSFLIRHDIDFDLQKALIIAILENEIGVKSTFFIMVTCEHYNVLSPMNKEIINQIKSFGHEIGIHFDPSIYDDYKKEFTNQVNVLENIIGNKVSSVSLHNPSIHGIYPFFENFNNSYFDPFYNENFYISDSCFDFRGKDMFTFIEQIKENSIQILIHPIHFSVNGGKEYIPILNEMIKNRTEKMVIHLKENKSFNDEVHRGYFINEQIIKLQDV
jgi:hypothetical protein